MSNLMTEAFRHIRQTHNVPENTPLCIEWTQPNYLTGESADSPLADVFDTPLVDPEMATNFVVHETGLVNPTYGRPVVNPQVSVDRAMNMVLRNLASYHPSDSNSRPRLRTVDRVLLFKPSCFEEECDIICGALSFFAKKQLPMGEINFEEANGFTHIAHCSSHRLRCWFNTYERDQEAKPVTPETVSALSDSMTQSLFQSIICNIASTPVIDFASESEEVRRIVNKRLMQAIAGAQILCDRKMQQAVLDAIFVAGKNRSLGITSNMGYSDGLKEGSVRKVAPRLGSWYLQSNPEGGEPIEVFSPFAPTVVVYPMVPRTQVYDKGQGHRPGAW